MEIFGGDRRQRDPRLQALNRCGGTLRQTARLPGISRNTPEATLERYAMR